MSIQHLVGELCAFERLFYAGWGGFQGTVIAYCILPGRNEKHQNKLTMPSKKTSGSRSPTAEHAILIVFPRAIFSPFGGRCRPSL